MTYPLDDITTFKTRATCEALVKLTHVEQLNQLAQSLSQQPFIVVGSGSNILFANDYHGCVVINQLRGIKVLAENEHSATISIAAGENWHDTVVTMSQKGFYGLENLALIPGTVGAAPVQNIGAYGVEIADFTEAVIVYDLQEQTTKTFSKSDCQFAYRDSFFKTPAARKRFIILTVILELAKTFSPVLSHQGLTDDGIPKTPAALLARVVEVRQNKLPDPNQLANAGSFFKNPVVSRQKLTTLQQQFTDIPYFELDEQQVKIPAAWLIQQSGFKGITRDNGAGVYEKHALILVNHGGAHGRDIYTLACDIMASVEQTFHIYIEPEVRIIGITANGENA